MAGLKNQSKIIARNDDPLFHFPSKKNESWRFLNLNEYKKNEFKAFKKNIYFKKINNLPNQSVPFNLDFINGNTNLNMLNNINTEAGFELIKIKETTRALKTIQRKGLGPYAKSLGIDLNNIRFLMNLSDFQLKDYNYSLRKKDIAIYPTEKRDNSKLLIFQRYKLLCI